MPTARGECTFVIKQGGVDRPFIVVEPSVGGIDIAFTVTSNVSAQEVYDLGERMRQSIATVLVSTPSPPRRRSRRARL
jgi:hypothetical protein